MLVVHLYHEQVYLYICLSIVGCLFLSLCYSHVFVHGLDFSLSCLYIFVHGLDIVHLGILDVFVVHILYLFACFSCVLNLISFDKYIKEVFVPSFLP